MARASRPSRLLPGRRSSPYTLILAALLMLSLLLLMLLALGIFSLPLDSNDAVDGQRHDRSAVETDEERGEQWTEVLSWEPRAFVYHNFLEQKSADECCITMGTSERSMSVRATTNRLRSGSILSEKECQYLIDLAKPHMAKSTVVDSATGRSKDSRVRTSSGMFLQRGQDKTIQKIEKRIADFTFIPAEHGEGLQVLHYEVGQKYEPHFDYFLDEFNTKNGGQRIATLLMYLTDVEEGGETIFPNAQVNSSSLPWYNELSECGKRGLSLKPKMGDALLFWSMRPDATLDPLSLHGGCPVIKGNKWSSTKWMHVNEYKV